jgi:hypothetical protein
LAMGSEAALAVEGVAAMAVEGVAAMAVEGVAAMAVEDEAALAVEDEGDATALMTSSAACRAAATISALEGSPSRATSSPAPAAAPAGGGGGGAVGAGRDGGGVPGFDGAARCGSATPFPAELCVATPFPAELCVAGPLPAEPLLPPPLPLLISTGGDSGRGARRTEAVGVDTGEFSENFPGSFPAGRSGFRGGPDGRGADPCALGTEAEACAVWWLLLVALPVLLVQVPSVAV